MKLFFHTLRLLWKQLLISMAVCAVIGLLFWLPRRSVRSPLPVILGCAAIGAVWMLWITALTARHLRREKHAEAVYNEYGVSPEYLEALRSAHPKPLPLDLLRQADILLALNRTDEAEAVLCGLDQTCFTPLEKLFFHNSRLLMQYQRGQYPAAIAEQRAHRAVMDDIASREPLVAFAYYDNAARLMALDGDRAEADRYAALLRDACGNTFPQSILPAISRTAVLYALGRTEQADDLAAQLHADLQTRTDYAHPWQQTLMLKLLDDTAVLRHDTT